ncbi:transporter substrate-binding domain-containing protein [Salidesulfovibrio onnuriiensis]|uniref:transporter substrate-binding domain-containing protein n=1 Tax=Salidesulfovibrio onnuriiensis TaxID=2583823 RepID=UPI0011CA720C|nr:transporter substrate-binding domain-containing protein [Salidesulfovibrio onnuriiensis]
MKKLVLTISMLLLVSFLAPGASAQEVWKITSLDWQPYSGSDMASQGNSIQKLRDLLQKEGIELKVEFYPWARAQKLASTADYVGYFPAWPEEVTEGFTASEPVDWSEIGVLTYKGSGLQWSGVDALFGEMVGLVGTYTYPQNITAAAAKNPANVDKASNEVALLKKLSGKRFRAAITDPAVMLYLASKEGIDNIETLKVLEKKALVVAFRNGADNKKRMELLKKLLGQ